MNVFVLGGKDRLREMDVRRQLEEAGFQVFHQPTHRPDDVYDAVDAFVLVFPTDKMGRVTAGWFMGSWDRRGYADRRGVFFLSEREIRDIEAGKESLPNLPGENNFFCKTFEEVVEALQKELAPAVAEPEPEPEPEQGEEEA